MTRPPYKHSKSEEEKKLRLLVNQRKYRETHREQIRAKSKIYCSSLEGRERREEWLRRSKEASREYFREYTKRNRERVRARNLLKFYGITQEQFDKHLLAQNTSCAICDSSNPGGGGRWRVDHDHVTGKVRGILCNVCNVMLGHAKDDPEILQNAIDYLKDPPFKG